MRFVLKTTLEKGREKIEEKKKRNVSARAIMQVYKTHFMIIIIIIVVYNNSIVKRELGRDDAGINCVSSVHSKRTDVFEHKG